MKAIVKFGPNAGDVKYTDMPMPKPEQGRALIKVKNAGICHTDITIINNEYKGRKPVPIPIILGHEGAGIIEELYSTNSCFKKGDRVAFEPLSGCSSCLNCKSGNYNMCTDWDHIGITYNGTFAEYIAIPETSIHKLPDEVSLSEAAVLEPLALTVRSLENIRPVLGDVAAIVGPGPIGLLHVQALKASGCRVIVIGLNQDEYRLKLASLIGADHVINASLTDPVSGVYDYTNGRGADIVIETASSPAALKTAFDLIGVKGRLSSFGLYPEVTIKYLDILRKGITVYGDVAMVSRHFAKAINWLKNKHVSTGHIISETVTLEDGIKAFEKMKLGNVSKIIIEM